MPGRIGGARGPRPGNIDGQGEEAAVQLQQQFVGQETRDRLLLSGGKLRPACRFITAQVNARGLAFEAMLLRGAYPEVNVD